jgi:hypothetical protein
MFSNQMFIKEIMKHGEFINEYQLDLSEHILAIVRSNAKSNDI